MATATMETTTISKVVLEMSQYEAKYLLKFIEAHSGYHNLNYPGPVTVALRNLLGRVLL
jgi:hypothetical protein